MDPGLSECGAGSVYSPLREGLIYRGQRLVNWDPALHTAISDLEVISEEEQGHLWHFTIRWRGRRSSHRGDHPPETMLGDTAVAVHPEDERYAHLIGRMVNCRLRARDSRSSPTTTSIGSLVPAV